jgi:sortase A
MMASLARHIERVTLAAGVLLLGVYTVARLDSMIGSRAAMRSIETQRPEPPENAQPMQQQQGPDFTLWSDARKAAFQRNSRPQDGEPLGVVSLDRLKIKAPVFAGTGELALNRGLGWIEGTARPGEPGNSGLAGHRDGFLRALKDVQVGDEIALRTRTARLLYRVDEIEIVTPNDIAVLRARDADSITLVTCYPFYFHGDAPQRFIVHARLEGQATARSD